MRLAVGSVPPLLDHLGLSTAGEALLATIPVLCYALGALGGPLIQSAFGEELAIFLALTAMTAGLFLRAVQPGWGLFLGTVIAGLAVAALNVLVPSLLKARFAKRIGDMTGLYTMILVVSTAVAAGSTVPIYHLAGESVGVALGVWCLPGA